MSSDFLRKIILEEINNVLKEQVGGTSREGPFSTQFSITPKPVQQSKVVPKRTQHYDMGRQTITGVKPSKEVMQLQRVLKSAGYNVGVVDGIPGPKLYNAISQTNKDTSGVSVSSSQVENDFEMDPKMAASNFLTALGSAEQLAASRNKSVSSRPVKPESAPSVAREMGRMPTRDSKPKVGDRMKGELGTEVWNGREWVPEGEYVPR